MAIQFGMRPAGLETHNDGLTLPYRLIGETDSEAAKLYAEQNTPLTLSVYFRKNIRLTGLGGGIWDVDVEFGTADKKDPEANDHTWSFDTGGGTKHITEGLEHIARYVRDGWPEIETEAGIGSSTNNDAPDGLDIPDRAFKWSETWHLPAANFGFVYSAVLGQITGCVNATYFRGLPPFSVLFHGGSGGQLSAKGTLREYTFNFEHSRPAVNARIGYITGINKAGWDHASVHYELADDEQDKKTKAKATQVDIVRVFEPANFALLGIGTGILE